jgi:tyrosinase
MTSPDDPVFFLYHCFLDKVWADWQTSMLENNTDWVPHYAPLRDGPKGHNLDDVLKPWDRPIKDMLDIAELDYGYEQPAQVMGTVSERAAPVFRSPFME